MTSKILRADGTTSIANIKSCIMTETVNAGHNLRPGCVASARIDVDVYGAASSAPAAGEALKYYTVDGSETLIGTFYAEPVIASKSMYTLTAFDAVSKLDTDYSKRLTAIQANFPMTIKALVQDACSVAGVTLGSTSWQFSGQSVNAFYADGITCRQIVQWAAELACCFVRCNAAGALVFGWYSAASNSIGPGTGTNQLAYRAGGLQYEAYDVQQVTSVLVQDVGADSTAYVYPSSVQSDTNPFVLSGNLLLTGAGSSLMASVATHLYDTLRALPTWRPFSANLFSFENTFRAGDIVSVTDIQNVTFNALVMTARTGTGIAELSSTSDETYATDTTNIKTRIAVLSAGVAAAQATADEALNQKIGGRNLFIAATRTNNYFINSETGALDSWNRCVTSDYIAVTPGDHIIVQYWCPAAEGSENNNRASRSIGFYNSSKTFVSDTIRGRYDKGYLIDEFDVPSGIAYIRVSWYMTPSGPLGQNWDIYGVNQIKVEKGNKPTDWSPAPEDVNTATEAARTLAAGKNTVTYSPNQPTTGVNGDIWFDTTYVSDTDGPLMYVYRDDTNPHWNLHQVGTTSIIDGSIVTDLLASNAVVASKIDADSINASGILTIGSMASSAQTYIAGSAKSWMQYRLSTSATELAGTGYDWQDTVPTWSTGLYVWTRTKTETTSIGGQKSYTYQPANGVYDSNVTTALSKATSAEAAANKDVTYYGFCDTAAATAAKTVTCEGFELVVGATITVKFYYGNTSSAGLTLNVNSTGAKDICVQWYRTSATNQLLLGEAVSLTFSYDGDVWDVVDAPGVFYAQQCSTGASTQAKTAALGSAVIMTGTEVFVPMANQNTHTSPTLNIGGTGAKSIVDGGGSAAPTVANKNCWLDGKSAAFRWTGSQWMLVDGSTVINGSHIQTGTIDASVVDVTNLNASKITTGSLEVKDSSNNTLFKADKDNKAVQVAGFTVDYNALYNGAKSSYDAYSADGIYLGDDGAAFRSLILDNSRYGGKLMFRTWNGGTVDALRASGNDNSTQLRGHNIHVRTDGYGDGDINVYAHNNIEIEAVGTNVNPGDYGDIAIKAAYDAKIDAGNSVLVKNNASNNYDAVMRAKVLWENPSPTTAMGAVTLGLEGSAGRTSGTEPLTDDPSYYDEIRIECRSSNASNSWAASQTIHYETGLYTYVQTLSGIYLYARSFQLQEGYVVVANGFYYDMSTRTSTSNSATMIPVRIVGIKYT